MRFSIHKQEFILLNVWDAPSIIFPGKTQTRLHRNFTKLEKNLEQIETNHSFFLNIRKEKLGKRI